MDRRCFLGAILAPGVALASPGWSEFWAQPRTLWLRRSGTNEEVKLTYWKDGLLLRDPYIQLCRFLRDVHTGDAVYMDPRILDLMFVVHGYQFSTVGATSRLTITNAYESKLTNRRLVMTHGASRTSRHMSGQAVDIANPIRPQDYVEYMKYLGAGGVGYYPDSGHMHLDTGPKRSWTKSKF